MLFKKNIIALLCLMTGMSVSATPYSVKGQAVDSLGEGEAYATIRIFAMPDTLKPTVMGVTDEAGRFDKTLPKAAKYRFTLNSVGKDLVVRDFEVSESKPVADLGRIVTTASGNLLGEVTVTASRPLITREIDRIGYDVQADEESKTSTLEETLRKVPMVSVDPDGTIKIKGSSNFKIYKNGRQNNSFTNNAKDIFKSIPAAMIKKIEVITDPGAREDAEGGGMILNIVTLENTVIKGVMGNASLNYTTNQNVPTPNIWLTSQIDKFTFSFYGGGGWNPSRARESRQYSERVFDDTGNKSVSSSESKGSADYGYFGLDMSLELDTLNLLTAEFSGFIHSFTNRSNSTTGLLNPAGDAIYSYDSYSVTDPYRGLNLNGSLNYQRSTHRQGEKITFSYMISGNGSKSDSKSDYTDTENMPVDYTGVNSHSDLNQTEHTLQIDWTRPLWSGHTLDVGAKYIYRDNHSITDQHYIGVRDTHTDFSHITQVGAAFADYRVNIGPLGLRAGVRYEYSRLSAKYKDGTQPDFASSLNDWVPNAGISLNINQSNSMRLTYGSRINRPGINYLNPAVSTSPTSTSQGNPDLSSVRNQSLNFNYSLFTSKLNLDFSAGYYFSSNDIISIDTSIDDHLYSSFVNGGKNRMFNTDLFVQWSATPKTSIMFNGDLSYSYFANPSLGLRNHGWSKSLFGRIMQRIPWKLSLIGTINYWDGGIGLYSVSKQPTSSCIFHTLILQRSFLKEDRLTVRLSANNPFSSDKRTYISYMVNTPYSGYSESTSYGKRSFSFSISYRFGKLNATVKKVNGISNDDVVGGMSRGSAGGGN